MRCLSPQTLDRTKELLEDEKQRSTSLLSDAIRKDQALAEQRTRSEEAAEAQRAQVCVLLPPCIFDLCWCVYMYVYVYLICAGVCVCELCVCVCVYVHVYVYVYVCAITAENSILTKYKNCVYLIQSISSIEYLSSVFFSCVHCILLKIESLKKQNEILHGQVQSLGIQVDRLNESRAISFGAYSTGSDETSPSSAAGSVSAETEITELRKMASELRDLVRCTQREKEMLTANLAKLELENARYSGSLASCQRSLDEARAELKRELDKRTTVRSEDEFNRLLTEVSQLQVIRESREHLSVENDQQAKSIAALRDELKRERDSNAPLQESLRVLTAEKEAWEMDRESLSNDVSYYQHRLSQLAERYNEVRRTHRWASLPIHANYVSTYLTTYPPI